MTRRQLADMLVRYGAALGAEVELLRHVRQLSADQHQATTQRDSERLHHVASERVRLMEGLVRIEHEIGTDRLVLAEHRLEATGLPGFSEVTELHRTAAVLVSEITSTDEGTLTALQQAEAVRHAAAQAIEAGETTLNAYRRVLAPAAHGPALVDRHG